MWNFCLPVMSLNNRVIAIDLLGHGQSECLGYIHTMEDQSHVIQAVLEFLKIDNATIIGHSMGGYVALAFAEMYHHKLNALVLMNSTALDDSQEKRNNRDRAIKMVKNDFVSFVKLSIANLFSEDSVRILKNDIENVKKEALKTPLQGIIAALEGMKIRKNRSQIFESLKIPKLLILSKKDPVLDFNNNSKQVENTDIKLLALEDGHMSHIENRAELLAILLEFVN